jgi:lipopolysaccharide export system protein LptA
MKNNTLKLLKITFLSLSFSSLALESDKQADFVLEGDNFKNLPVVKGGLTKIKYWGNVSIEQGTLKIKSDSAVIFNGKDGISKVVLAGKPVMMEQFIDAEFGKIDVNANTIDFMVKDDLLLMNGNVVIKSKVQGEMSGEKISMNLKTKEIKGIKSENKRVKLIIKPRN